MSDRFDELLEAHPRLAGMILFLATFLVYAQSLANGFVYDDEYQILQNPFVLNRHLWTKIFTGSVWSFQGVASTGNFYRPLHIFSYWLIYRLAGPNPAAFHLLQLLVYATTVVVVYRLGRRLLHNEKAALLSAMLWAVHPLHVEAVAWIGGVPDTGYGLFCLLGFLAFLRVESFERPPALAHSLAAVIFLPALFFKEMALSFPLLIAVYWLFCSPPTGIAAWRDRALRLAPYLVVVAFFIAIRTAALGFVTQVPRPWRITPRVAGAAVGLLGGHTRMFFVPTHLNVFRTFDLGPGLASPWPWLMLVASFAALWFRREQPLLGFLVFWWVIGLAPCLDIRQLSFPLLGERFSYVPSVALCLAISHVFIVWLPARAPAAHPATLGVPALGAVMLFHAVQTFRAIPHWHDNETLANYSLKQSPDAALLHEIHALLLHYGEGDFDGATQEYETAIRLNRSSLKPLIKITYDCFVGLGQIAYQRGRREEAIRYFKQAIQVSPFDSPAYDALGSVYFPRGDYARAAEYYVQAVKANPQDIGARFSLGTCWLKLGRHREAAEQFRAAREVDPSFRQAYAAEAQALRAAGDALAARRVLALGEKGGEE